MSRGPGTMSQREQEKRIAQLLERMRVEATPFPDDTPAKRRRRVQRVRDGDFAFFCRTYLPHHFDTDLSRFHQELCDLSEVRGRPVVVAAPSGHGKSTTLGLAGNLYDIVRQSRHFIVVGSTTEDVATLMTASIKAELEFNERIQNDFGAQRGQTWGDGWFITKSGVAVLARGRGQAIRGFKHGPHRPDKVVIDDPEDIKQARNPDRVRDLLYWITNDIIPRLCRGGAWSLIWLGTILVRKSALDQVIRGDRPEYSHWERRLYRAIQDDGTPLCPELHSIEDLDRMKALLGSVVFAAEYMNDPVDEFGLFREEWFSEYKPALLDSELAHGLTTAFLDPSVKKGEHNDFKALVTITRHPRTAELYVRDAWIRKASIDAMIHATYDSHRRWQHQRIGLEDVGFQSLLFRDFAAAARDYGYHLPLAPVRQSMNKEVRIAGLSPLHERGVIHYPEGFPGDIGILREQLVAFPSRTVNDDGPDAEEGAVRLSEHTATRMDYTSLATRRFHRQGGRCGDASEDYGGYSHLGSRGGSW